MKDFAPADRPCSPLICFTLRITVGLGLAGLALGGPIQGIKVERGAYAGGWFDWLTGFSVSCGSSVVVGCALLGARRLVRRTEGARRWSRWR